MCPYCGCNQWYNCWGRQGNACCTSCERQFNVIFLDGQHRPTGIAIETHPALSLEEIQQALSAGHTFTLDWEI